MRITKIVLPVRPQPDTILAIWLLKRFGQQKYPGIDTAAIVIDPNAGKKIAESGKIPEDEILIDVGGGPFDHHKQNPPTTASFLVAKSFGISGDPALSKMLRYAERDDKFGLGTVSKDQTDRAFGLSGLIGALNKQHPQDSAKVISIVIPLFEAHYGEEVVKLHELPGAHKELVEGGKSIDMKLSYNGADIRAVLIESDNISLPGYLRAQAGGKYDIVAQRRSTGHVNILSRPQKTGKIDLSRLAALIRASEYYMHTGTKAEKKFEELSAPARTDEAPNWYYDTATNSIQNGGVHTDLTPATEIPWDHFPKMLEMAFSKEQ